MSNSIDIRKFIAEIAEHFEVVGKYHVSEHVPKQLTNKEGILEDSFILLTGPASPLRYGKPLVLMHPDHEETFLKQIAEHGVRWERVDWKTEPFRDVSEAWSPMPYLPDEAPDLRPVWRGYFGYG